MQLSDNERQVFDLGRLEDGTWCLFFDLEFVADEGVCPPDYDRRVENGQDYQRMGPGGQLEADIWDHWGHQLAGKGGPGRADGGKSEGGSFRQYEPLFLEIFVNCIWHILIKINISAQIQITICKKNRSPLLPRNPKSKSDFTPNSTPSTNPTFSVSSRKLQRLNSSKHISGIKRAISIIWDLGFLPKSTKVILLLNHSYRRDALI